MGTATSPPAADMVREMMKGSDNQTASLLFAHAGRSLDSTANRHPEESGVWALNQFLAEADLPAAEVQIEEGSGLSRNSLVTPNAIVGLLVHMHEHTAAEDFLTALPIAGVDGTLAERFLDTAAQQNLRAKTGTLRWAQALSGYVTSRAGEKLAFSILLNRYRPAESDAPATQEVDAVALYIATLPVQSTGDSPVQSRAK